MDKFERREIEAEGMPFDRFDNGVFVHATGFEYWDPIPVCWRTEYEDDPSYLETLEKGEA